MKTARVFPSKTRMTPVGPDIYYGPPPMDALLTEYDRVEISVTFTWDLDAARRLKDAWTPYCHQVEIGGPALDDPGAEFVAGRYVRPGVAVTSRGCPNRCGFCFAWQREGKIRELGIQPGNNIIDNNLLACQPDHIDRVFAMLKGQRAVEFTGGLEAGRVTDDIVERLRGLRIESIWLAYDSPSREGPLVKALKKLTPYFTREQLRCYVLAGFDDQDSVSKARSRLHRAWELGTIPMVMLYQGKEWRDYPPAWMLLQHNWTRPANIKMIAKDGFERDRRGNPI